MNARPTSGTRQQSGSRMLGWVAVATLVAAALTVGSDVHGAFAQSASPSSEPTPTPTPVPTPTLDPGVPTPDPNRTFVLAWSAVRNPDPANGGPWLLLSGWRFSADFEGARVIRSHPVTRITEENADPAFWELEFTDESARAAVTVVPKQGARLLDVECVSQFESLVDPVRVNAQREGNRVSFEVVREFEDYECFYIYARGTVPPTDTFAGAPVPRSHGPGLVLALLAGLVAGALFLKSHQYGPAPRRTVRVVPRDESGVSTDS